MNYRLPKIGDKVNIIEKRNYESGILTHGTVKKLLSHPQEVHPRGNKVMLEDGTVGRVVSYVDEVGVRGFVDPSLRDKLAKEVRENRPAVPRPNNRFGTGERAGFRRDRNFRERNEPAEPPVDLSNLPGEDDLR